MVERQALTQPQWTIYEAGWKERSRFRVAVCGRRFGKALCLKTMLPTPSGWTTMGELQIGDLLLDERGAPCRVLFATDVMHGRPCNLMTFLSGAEVIADDDHVWRVSWDEADDELCTTSRLRYLLASGNKIRIRPVDWSRRATTLDCDHHSDPTKLINPSVAVTSSDNSQGDRRSKNSQVMIWHELIKIDNVPSRPVRCITVDSRSSLFLCTKFLIPTHNTFLMAEELRRAARLAVSMRVGVENEIWYGAPNFLQAKRVMWARLKRAIPQSWIAGKPVETNCSIRLVSGHTIRLVGLDSCDNLRGSGLWFFGGDEWADCRPEAWLEVIRPMLSTTQGHALFIGTPKGFDHFRDAYLLGQSDSETDYKSFLYTTMDGGNVPRQEIEAAQRELDERTFRQEYCASFETYAGRVIYAFSRAENVMIVPYRDDQDIHIGVDFNVNPMSATVWQDCGETVCQVDEIVMPTSNTDELGDEIARRYGRHGFDRGSVTVDHITVYPDPAGTQRRTSAGGRTDIGILQEKGFKVRVLRSHPAVRERMNLVNRQFKTAGGRIGAVIHPKCARSIEAYERLVFVDGTNEPDKTHGYDHLVDATGYFMCGRYMSRDSRNGPSIMER